MKKSKPKNSAPWYVRIKLSSDLTLTNPQYIEHFVDNLASEHVKHVNYYYDKEDPNDAKEVFDMCKSNILNDCKLAITQHTRKFDTYSSLDHIILNEDGFYDSVEELMEWLKRAVIIKNALNKVEI